MLRLVVALAAAASLLACAHRSAAETPVQAIGEPKIELVSPAGAVTPVAADGAVPAAIDPALAVAPAVAEGGPAAVEVAAVLPPSDDTREGALGEDDSVDDEVVDEGSAEDGEDHDEPVEGAELSGHRYTAELSDEELQRLWTEDLEKLGSMSFGYADEGRLINARQFPRGEHWRVVSPHLAYATEETIQYTIAAIERVKAQFPDAYPLRVNQISAPEGGYLRPHRSHQNGRDVDLGFYYPGTPDPIRARAREKVIDVPKNWALLRALITETDVQTVLLDRRVQRVIYEYALSIGEDEGWLRSLFHSGRQSVVQHARGHRDHFHVRFYNPRAQELGRRVAPLLAQRPEHNVAMHRVRRGDTLGHLARRYGSTVSAIQRANRMRGTFLRLSQVLKIPLRKPCNQCPVPAAVVVPPRRLPPQAITASAPAAPTRTALGGAAR